MLMTESIGKCSDFNAEPGYGLRCRVSNIENMLTKMDKESRRTREDGIINSLPGK